MFTVEIKVNGSLVSHIHGTNISPDVVMPGAKDEYRYGYYEIAQGRVITGMVKHKRTDGIGPLVVVILNDVRKKLDAEVPTSTT